MSDNKCLDNIKDMIVAVNKGQDIVDLPVVDLGSNLSNSSSDTGKVGFARVLDATCFCAW